MIGCILLQGILYASFSLLLHAFLLFVLKKVRPLVGEQKTVPMVTNITKTQNLVNQGCGSPIGINKEWLSVNVFTFNIAAMGGSKHSSAAGVQEEGVRMRRRNKGGGKMRRQGGISRTD